MPSPTDTSIDSSELLMHIKNVPPPISEQFPQLRTQRERERERASVINQVEKTAS